MIFRPTLTHLLSAALPLAVAACGIWNAPTPQAAEAKQGQVQGRLPLALEVLQERNDGQNLAVLARISSKTAWPLEAVVARLVGMNEGRTIVSRYYSFLEKNPERKYVEPDDPLEFSLSLPASGITDYQLELVWGRDAKSYYYSKSGMSGRGTGADAGYPAPVLKLQEMELERRPVDCAEQACFRYTISGMLLNAGPLAVEKVTLGVRLQWVRAVKEGEEEEGASGSEAMLELKHLGLAPGGKRPVRFEIDRTIPELPDGYYQPVLRIVSFSEQ